MMMRRPRVARLVLNHDCDDVDAMMTTTVKMMNNTIICSNFDIMIYNLVVLPIWDDDDD